MNRIDDRDWSALTLGERIRQIEVEGYLLLPHLLPPNHVARLKAETAKLETKAVDYSVHQRGVPKHSVPRRSDNRTSRPSDNLIHSKDAIR